MILMDVGNTDLDCVLKCKILSFHHLSLAASYLSIVFANIFYCLFFLVMIATQEEMESAKLPLEDRDYCAHLLIKYRACRADKAPWLYKCEHEKHEYLNCQYQE